MAEIKVTFTGQAQDINAFTFDLFEANSLEAGRPKTLPGGSTITLLPMMIRKSFGVTRDVEVILTVAGSVGVNILSNYIYDKLKKQEKGSIRLTINRREVHIDHSEISKVIAEEITIDSRD